METNLLDRECQIENELESLSQSKSSFVKEKNEIDIKAKELKNRLKVKSKEKKFWKKL